jgi:hypothetical protein
MEFNLMATKERMLQWLEEGMDIEEPSAWITPRDKEILDRRNKEAKMIQEIRASLEEKQEVEKNATPQ